MIYWHTQFERDTRRWERTAYFVRVLVGGAALLGIIWLSGVAVFSL